MAAPVDPWSAGLMALGSVAGSTMQKAPTTSTGIYSSEFDSSGWNVNTGPGSISSSAQKSSALGIDNLLNTLLGSPLLLIGGALLVVYLFKKK